MAAAEGAGAIRPEPVRVGWGGAGSHLKLAPPVLKQRQVFWDTSVSKQSALF